MKRFQGGQAGWLGFLASLVAVACFVGGGMTSAHAVDTADEKNRDNIKVDTESTDLFSIGASKAATAEENLSRAPLVACPMVVLPNNGGTSANERAPNPYWLYGRSVYLITAAELAAAGLPNGSTPSGIGWTFSTIPTGTATGSLIVYLQNTADTTNTKSTTWSTAISGMTTVHNATTTLPANQALYDITFTGGSAFTYNGGGLYVAFDWQWAGPYLTAANYCNTSLTGGLKGAYGDAGPYTALTASNFRPETRLTVTTTATDVSVDYVVTMGSLPTALVGSQTVKAVISNKGVATSNVSVSLNMTGAQAFSDTQTVASLAACNGQAIVSFAPFTPNTIGSNTVTVSVPADSNSANNSKSKPLDETYNLYSYKHPGTTASGGFGVTGGTAALVAKFTTTAAAKASAINLEFFATSATTYRTAIYPDVSGAPGLTPLYVDAADRTVTATGPVTIALSPPVAVGPGNFYVGIHQTNTTNASLSFDNENPIRSAAFYGATPIPAASWFDFAPGNNFKPNIGVTLIQCTVDADCNDNNVCTDEFCNAQQLCVRTNNSNACSDGNPCTGPDTCVAGACVSGPNPCEDHNACTNDVCGEGGSCTYPAVNCDDANPCTDDGCVPATGCTHTNNTAPCSDGNPCTSPDACANGACAPGPPIPITPVQFCSTGLIDILDAGAGSPYPSSIGVSGRGGYLCKLTVDLNGMTHTYPADIDVLLSGPGPQNAIIMSDVGAGNDLVGVNLLLDDAAPTPLPVSAAITSGTYQPTNSGAGDTFPASAPTPLGGSALSVFNGTNPNGTWDLWVVDDASGDTGTIDAWCLNVYTTCQADVDCNDNNPCTDDTCASGVCYHASNANSCDDGNACTTGEVCSGGACGGGTPRNCDDQNACTIDACNTQTGQCVYGARVCNDNNSCTTDVCVGPTTGCVYTVNDANPCTDDNLCTTDACVNGTCVGTPSVFCDDGNLCTADACNPATGQCEHAPSPGAACDDGNLCTSADVCICDPGVAGGENFDGVTAPDLPSGWSSDPAQSWATQNTVSQSAPNAAYSNEPATVSDKSLVSPVFTPLAGGQVTFQQQYAFEGSTICWDGGVLEISVNAGAWQDIIAAGGAWVTGGYNGTVYTGYQNPLEARPAWCLNTAGAWVAVAVTIPPAAAGQAVQLRWRLGSDNAVSATGWYVDSIVLPVCSVLCSGTPTTCTGDQCHDAGVCNPQTGACVNPAKPDGTACDDGNACTVPDSCTNGNCSGAPVPPPTEVNNSVRLSGGGGGGGSVTIGWSDLPGPYNVYRGLKAGLWTYNHTCFDPNTAGPSTDTSNPGPGGMYYYLVARRDACGESVLGRDSAGAPDPNPTPCP